MKFLQLPIGPMQNFAYVFGDEEGNGAIVDPGFEPERIVEAAESLGLRIETIFATHAHWDHVQEIPRLRKLTGAKVAAHPHSPLKPQLLLHDGSEIRVGSVRVRAVHTPGHEPTALCLVVDGTHLLTGDTLFVGECGRADLPGSDPGALWHSLQRTLRGLPGDLVVCPGHDYGPTPTSTLEREFRENYTLKPRTKDEFVAFMATP